MRKKRDRRTIKHYSLIFFMNKQNIDIVSDGCNLKIRECVFEICSHVVTSDTFEMNVNTEGKPSCLTTCDQINKTNVDTRCKQGQKGLDRVQNHMYWQEVKHLLQVSDTSICVLASLASCSNLKDKLSDSILCMAPVNMYIQTYIDSRGV